VFKVNHKKAVLSGSTTDFDETGISSQASFIVTNDVCLYS